MCWFTFFCFYSICGQKPNPNDNTRGFSWSVSYPAPHKPFPSLLSFIKSSSALPVSSPTYPSILQVSRMHLPDKMTLNTFFPQIQVLAFSFLCVWYDCMCLCVGQRLMLGILVALHWGHCCTQGSLFWLVQLASLPQGWIPVHLPSNGITPIYLGFGDLV